LIGRAGHILPKFAVHSAAGRKPLKSSRINGDWSRGQFMVLIVRFACALALMLMLCAASAVHASPQAAISAMKGRQATEWRRTVIDLNLVGSYYDDPANQPIWVKNASPTPAAAELLEALSRAEEDGLDTNDYLSEPIIDADRLANDADAAGYELAMSQAFLAFARDIHSGQTSPAVNASDIVIPRKPVDAVAWLSLARDSGVEGALESSGPSIRNISSCARC
jgi:murein L,D-transpeptidase YcbB/YkuD